MDERLSFSHIYSGNSPSVKCHDLSNQVNGCDYIFESVTAYQGYITGQGARFKPGDTLIIQLNKEKLKYRIEHIDYYSDPCDMWTAMVYLVS